MKHLLGNLLIGLLALITLLLLGGLFLPRGFRIERSIEIRSTPEAIYADLGDVQRWPEWTVWNQQLDPSVQFTFGSPSTGPGAEYQWSGNKLGRGRLRLDSANPTNGVTYSANFNGGTLTSEGSISLRPAGDAIRVDWMNQGDLGRSPFTRYGWLLLGSKWRAQFDQGLTNLKQRAEAAAR